MSLEVNNGYLDLGAAVLDLDEALVETILKEGVEDIDAVDFYDRTALHYAARLGDHSIGHKLIEAGCHADKTDSCGVTALHIAACKGHGHFVRLLLENGCMVNQPASDGIRSLHCAAGNGHTSVVRLLLNREVEVDWEGLGDRTAQVEVDWEGPGDRTALYMAAECGHTDIVKALIEANARVNIASDYGLTPLGTAAFNNHTDSAVALIHSGAKVNRGDYKNNTPLHHAVRVGNMEIVMELLKNGSHINIMTKNFESPVHIAVGMGHVDILSVLVSHGSDVNLCEPVGNVTPLHVAVNTCSDVELFNRLFQQLLKGSCILNWRAFSTLETPFYRALQLHKDKIASILLSNGADPNLASPFDITALQKACQGEKYQLVEMILNCGVNWNRESWLKKYWTNDLHVFLRKVTRNDQINDLLYQWRWQILPLHIQCRLVIRYSIGENLSRKIRQLPLPIKFQQFLLLSEFL